MGDSIKKIPTIDFHAHILPDMDDGSRSAEESVLMLEKLAEDGISHVVMTPHFYARKEDPVRFLKRRSQGFAALHAKYPKKTPIFIAGAEVEYFEGITEMTELAKMRMGGTCAILIEMPFARWSDRVLSDVVELSRRPEYDVVIAHIERYARYQSEETIGELIGEGIVMQSNASYFLSRNMGAAKALNMLKNGYIQLLGSDAHNMTSRPPDLGRALSLIEKKLGYEEIKKLSERGVRLLSHKAP